VLLFLMMGVVVVVVIVVVGGGGGYDSTNSNRMKNLRMNNGLRPFDTSVILPEIKM
jgi:hypothetical protein